MFIWVVSSPQSTEVYFTLFDGYCEVLCDKVLYNVKKQLLLIGFGSCTSRVTLTGLCPLNYRLHLLRGLP